MAAPTELLSIQGVTLGKNQYVAAFNIKTWGVTVLSVCRVPFAWRVTAGEQSDPEGILAGEGDTFGSYLSAQSLSEITFLIKVENYQAYPRGNPKGEYHPATFAGSITVDKPGTDEEQHSIRLSASNFVRTPASTCPTHK